MENTKVQEYLDKIKQEVRDKNLDYTFTSQLYPNSRCKMAKLLFNFKDNYNYIITVENNITKYKANTHLGVDKEYLHSLTEEEQYNQLKEFIYKQIYTEMVQAKKKFEESEKLRLDEENNITDAVIVNENVEEDK